MLKYFIKFLTILLLISACGFSPMYSSKNTQLYNIKILNLEGDNKINSIIKQRLKITKILIQNHTI